MDLKISSNNTFKGRPEILQNIRNASRTLRQQEWKGRYPYIDNVLPSNLIKQIVEDAEFTENTVQSFSKKELLPIIEDLKTVHDVSENRYPFLKLFYEFNNYINCKHGEKEYSYEKHVQKKNIVENLFFRLLNAGDSKELVS